MAIISRQTGLLTSENWKKVYQTFREADFTAYDFETLRKSMIDYIKINYAEDFNDFTESSEFIALIDLIAFLGQSLAFRTDLNARENFMDTAERRDSILKLARMISYNPKRTIGSSGFLKIDSVSTTETIYDSDGIDLANTPILWNDLGNENWLEQFTAIINSALITGQIFGKPSMTKTIGGVRNDEYQINVTPNIVPVFRFAASIEGQDMTFEAVSATTYGQDYIYESEPDVGKAFNILFKNDSNGNASNNTGFFIYFKQGELGKLDFTLSEMIPNRVINVNVNNINNTDTWLYSIDSQGLSNEQWKKVPSTSGVNIIYNDRKDRNLFQVNSRLNDQVALVFGDGAFANMPQGSFRFYYRTSNGLTYRITPDEMRGISISFDYVSKYNRIETLSFRASLRYTVANAVSRESIEDIKQRAPQQYYTQNRMVTGEDYNILPYTNYSNVTKVKSINRTSSGLSRYLDVLDTTGKYSSTNTFGQDGTLYVDRYTEVISFSFNNTVDIRRVIRNRVIPEIIAGKELMHYFYDSVTEERPIDVELGASNLINGETYTIIQTGTTDFLQFGSASNSVGASFIAANAGKITKEYSIVPNGTSSYVFTGDELGNNIDITIRVGDVLKFNINASGHPLWIKTIRATGLLFGVTTGIIQGNGAIYGEISWNTIGVVPGEYYYICQNHSEMSGKITVLAYGTGKVTTGVKWNLSTILDSGITGYFSYNNQPAAISTASGQRSRFMKPGAMLRCVAPQGYYFNSMMNLLPGVPLRDTDTTVIYTAITQVVGNGTNNGLGNFANGIGPVTLNQKIPSGTIIQGVIPAFNNSLPDSIVTQMVNFIESFVDFGLIFNAEYQAWQLISPTEIVSSTKWWLKFEYSTTSNLYNIYYKGIRYVFHSPTETNFYFNEPQRIYDSENNTIIKDNIKVLSVNRDPRTTSSLGKDLTWAVYKPIIRNDGYVENKSIYLTYADSNDDGVPDTPDLFERIVLGTPLTTIVENPTANYNAFEINRYYKIYLGRYPNQNELDYYVTLSVNGFSLLDIENLIKNNTVAVDYRNGISYNNNFVFFELNTGYDQYNMWKQLDSNQVISNFKTLNELTTEVVRAFDTGQLIYVQGVKNFYKVQSNYRGDKSIGNPINDYANNIIKYQAYVGRSNLYYQYRHNSPNTNRIDPSISNIIDIYMLTNEYDTNYRQWVQDTTNKIIEPTAPTNTELQVSFYELENFKSISDTMVFHSAEFKPLFGSKADANLQATFKVVKNSTLNLSDSEIKSRVISTINEYFAIENWDFGETFYFSELAAYLHKELSPDIASIIIVPKDINISFGSFYQINAEPYEILISAATVDDVEIITAITAAQLNQKLSIENFSIGI